MCQSRSKLALVGQTRKSTLDFAKRMEDAGDDNGEAFRTRARYNGFSQVGVIGRVKEVLIPVIANGDIFPSSGGEVSGANWC